MKNLLIDLLKAIKYLDRNQLNIKPQNILINREIWKLGDISIIENSNKNTRAIQRYGSFDFFTSGKINSVYLIGAILTEFFAC